VPKVFCIVLKRPQLHFWREFTDRVTIFSVGIKPGIKPNHDYGRPM